MEVAFIVFDSFFGTSTVMISLEDFLPLFAFNIDTIMELTCKLNY